LPEERPERRLIEVLEEAKKELLVEVEMDRPRPRSKSVNKKSAWKPSGGFVYTWPPTGVVMNKRTTEEPVVRCQPIVCEPVRCEPISICYEPKISQASGPSVERVVYPNWASYCKSTGDNVSLTLPPINQNL
jgi:hypothetical protein